MPELPEVETTRLRLTTELEGKEFSQVLIRTGKLRLPVPPELATILPGQHIRGLGRRGKYLLVFCDNGCLIIHLGMTGFLRVITTATPPGRHDHLDFILTGNHVLRFHDPRKFGTVIWTDGDPLAHPLLANIGPEPMSPDFNGACLYDACRSRKVAIKQFIMNACTVAGIGNIYANEALFLAGIRPDRPAMSLSLQECGYLAGSIKKVLGESIEQGSTYQVAEDTVRYHPLTFNVYNRGGTTCRVCGEELLETRLGNRSTVYCPGCQR